MIVLRDIRSYFIGLVTVLLVSFFNDGFSQEIAGQQKSKNQELAKQAYLTAKNSKEQQLLVAQQRNDGLGPQEGKL